MGMREGEKEQADEDWESSHGLGFSSSEPIAKLKRQRKIALLNPTRVRASSPTLSRVGRRQRVGQATQWGSKSSIFHCRGVLQLPLLMNG